MNSNLNYYLRTFILPGLILLILLSVVGIRFANLSEKTREGTTVGRLFHIRQALLLYYQDHNGVFPKELSNGSPFGRYMEQLPAVAKLHPQTGVLSPRGNEVFYGTESPKGYGQGWYYNYENGMIFINSIGLDTRGVSYTAY